MTSIRKSAKPFPHLWVQIESLAHNVVIGRSDEPFAVQQIQHLLKEIIHNLEMEESVPPTLPSHLAHPEYKMKHASLISQIDHFQKSAGKTETLEQLIDDMMIAFGDIKMVASEGEKAVELKHVIVAHNYAQEIEAHVRHLNGLLKMGSARREHEEWAKENPHPSKWSDEDWSEYNKKELKPKDKKSSLTNQIDQFVSLAHSDPFTHQYMETLLWSSTDETTPQGGEPLDKNYTVADISPECKAEMEADCKSFQEANADLLNTAYNLHWDPSSAGHDFALTRNRHGAGFWDRGHGEVGRALTDAAHAYGEVNLYVGDDGKIHCM